MFKIEIIQLGKEKKTKHECASDLKNVSAHVPVLHAVGSTGSGLGLDPTDWTQYTQVCTRYIYFRFVCHST